MKTLAIIAALLLSTAAQAAKLQELRDVSVSPAQATATGSWSYALRRSAHAWTCDDSAASGQCLEYIVAVNNQSAETLECKLRLEFKRLDGSIVNTFESPALVLPRTHPEVHATISDDQTHAEIAALACWARKPYQRVAKAAGCKYTMMGKPFETYYPAEAKQKSMQGPLIISFLLDQRDGTAKDVTVAESSLFPLLDWSATRFIRDQEFRTNCPGTRFDVLMRFRLRDEVVSSNR
jgi:TonB family protein